MRGVLSSLEQTLKWSVQSAESKLPPLAIERFQGYLSPLSFAHILSPRHTCLRLLTQAMRLAFALLAAKAGRSRPARIAMIAITTSNSISVKANCARLIIRYSRFWSSGAPGFPHAHSSEYSVPIFSVVDGPNWRFCPLILSISQDRTHCR